MNKPLDVDFVRRQFPALSDSQVFMDNAGGSLTLGRVADRIRDYLLTTNVQLGASYRISAAASERYATARQRIAEMLNAASSQEIVFGPSTTILLKLLARAVATALEPGDEVVVTRIDHEANIGCWLELESVGAKVRFWERNSDSGDLELEDLDALLGDRTRLVCLTHVSNILGTINPVRDISRRVHEHGAWVCIDGVAHAPHRAIDVQALDVDFYALSFYKTYGPHHAVLYGRKEALLEVGSANHFFFANDHIPGKLEPGNANYELSWGAAGIVDYLEELGTRLVPGTDGRAARDAAWHAIAAHEQKLSERLLGFLQSRSDVRIIGRPEASAAVRVPTVSFVHEKLRSVDVVTAVDPHDIGIRFGHFYALRLIRDLSLPEEDGVVRVSMVHYNTLEEVDRLIAALEPALDGRQGV